MHWKTFDYNEWKEEDEKFDHKGYDEDFKKAQESTTDLMKFIELIRKLPHSPHRPNAFYNKDGDMIEVYLSNDTVSYGKWLCPQITLLLCQETDEIIGVNIYGIKRLLEKDGDE